MSEGMLFHTAAYLYLKELGLQTKDTLKHTAELQWLEHLGDHGHLFEIWVVRATER